MAKQKMVQAQEAESEFLLLRVSEDTPDTRVTVRGWYFDSPGVLLKTITELKDADGNVVSSTEGLEFKRGARINPVCVDDKITHGNLVGGE